MGIITYSATTSPLLLPMRIIMLEYIPKEIPRTAFRARRNKFNYTVKWHLRPGYPDPKTLGHLAN
jgi:hypothetical protein